MITKINSQFLSSNVFTADFVVDQKTFDTLREKITDQYLKNIDIPGFRKGFAPKEKSMAKADMVYLENLVWNETITRNYPEAERMVNEEVAQRTVVSIALSQDAQNIGMVEGGFKFQLVSNLLPDINLDFLKDLSTKEITESDLPSRINLEEYLAKEQANFVATFNEYETAETTVSSNSRLVADITEKNLTDTTTEPRESKSAMVNLGMNQFPAEFETNLIGTKAGDSKSFQLKMNTKDGEVEFEFTVNILSVQAPKYSTIQDLFTNVEFVAQNFVSVADFDQNLIQRYNAETQDMLQNAKMKAVMTSVVAKAGEVEVEAELVEKETTRIFEEISKNADAVKVFNDTQFPFTGLATTETLRQEVSNYVNGEFKLSKVLMVVYYQKVQNKTTEEEIANASKEIQKSPEKYGYPKDSTLEQLKDQIFDTLLRNKALDFLLSVTQFV